MPAPDGSLAAFADDDTVGKHDATGLVKDDAAHANWMPGVIGGGATQLILSWLMHQIPPAPIHSVAECQNVRDAVLESAAALPDLARMVRSGAFHVQCDLVASPGVRA